jgi:hypothetical protein
MPRRAARGSSFHILPIACLIILTELAGQRDRISGKKTQFNVYNL